MNMNRLMKLRINRAVVRVLTFTFALMSFCFGNSRSRVKLGIWIFVSRQFRLFLLQQIDIVVDDILNQRDIVATPLAEVRATRR